MPKPTITFADDELTLKLEGMGPGWTFGHLREIRLLDHAQLQFPSHWTEFQIKAGLHLVDTTWRLHSDLILRTTLEAGAKYNLKDGTSGDLALSGELLEHILQRPTVNLDLSLKFNIKGEITEHGFSGSTGVMLWGIVHF